MADEIRRGEAGRQGRDSAGGGGDRAREAETKREFEAFGMDETAERAAGEPATGPRAPQEPRSAHTRGGQHPSPERHIGEREASGRQGGERKASGRNQGRGVMDKLRNAWHRARPGRD